MRAPAPFKDPHDVQDKIVRGDKVEFVMYDGWHYISDAAGVVVESWDENHPEFAHNFYTGLSGGVIPGSVADVSLKSGHPGRRRMVPTDGIEDLTNPKRPVVSEVDDPDIDIIFPTKAEEDEAVKKQADQSGFFQVTDPGSGKVTKVPFSHEEL